MPLEHMPCEIDTDDLPETLAEIIEVVGLAAALRLVEGWGGLRLYIPTPGHIGESHPLAVRLGHPEAVALAEIYAREKIDVPNCRGAVRRVRDRRIVASHRDGVSVRQLAIEFHLTERAIWMVLAREPEHEQPGLFD